VKYPLNAFTDGIEALLRNPDMRVVTVFIPPKTTCNDRIRITRKARKGKGSRVEEQFCITCGRPNWSEREFLKLCKRAKCNPKRMKFSFWSK
jgi:hypothetical protein